MSTLTRKDKDSASDRRRYLAEKRREAAKVGAWRTFRRLPAWHPYRDASSPAGTPESLAWSGDGPPPEVGRVIEVRCMGTTAEVRGYFSEGSGCFLGLRLRLVDPPDWFMKQNGRRALCHLYGAEVSRGRGRAKEEVERT